MNSDETRVESHPTTKQRVVRLWAAFMIIWATVLGYQAYSAHQAASVAHDNAQGARVGGNILRSSNPDLVSPDDSNFGDGAVQRLEAIEDKTKRDWETALKVLIGGLLAGTAVIWLFYWIMFGAVKHSAKKSVD